MGVSELAKVNLTLLNGNQREFLYDYAFDSATSQVSSFLLFYSSYPPTFKPDFNRLID